MNIEPIARQRPSRNRSFGVVRKLLSVNWLFVLCICLLFGVGYAALYSAGGGSVSPYANSQLVRFLGMLALMFVLVLRCELVVLLMFR